MSIKSMITMKSNLKKYIFLTNNIYIISEALVGSLPARERGVKRKKGRAERGRRVTIIYEFVSRQY